MRTLLLSLTQTRTNCAVAYGDFFGEIVTEWKKAPNLAQSFFLVQGTNLERVPPETTTGGGGEGSVRWDLTYPYIHQRESQGEAFRALFCD